MKDFTEKATTITKVDNCSARIPKVVQTIATSCQACVPTCSDSCVHENTQENVSIIQNNMHFSYLFIIQDNK